MRRTAPRPFARALETASLGLAPDTTLALVQCCWGAAVGTAIAEQSAPSAERGGAVTVSCRSAVWTHELELLANELLEHLNSELEQLNHDASVAELRFVTARL